MDTVKSAIFIACAMGIVSTLIDISAPSGSTKNQLAVIAGIVTLLCVITPFTSDGFKISLEEQQLQLQSESLNSSIDYYTQNALLDTAAEKYEEYFLNKLNSNGIEAKGLQIQMSLSESYEISADSITVKLSDLSQSEEAQSLIREDLPEIEITFIGEEEQYEASP